LTSKDYDKLLGDEVNRTIRSFPYLIVNDPHRILDRKIVVGPDIITYESEKDYTNVRMKSELAKSFKLGPTIFLFSDKSAERYFADLYAWFEQIDVDERILEFLSERLNEHPSALRPIQPLIVHIFTEKKTVQLEGMLASSTIKERPIELDALRDSLLSILLNQDISGENVEQKISKLFIAVFDPEKCNRLWSLLTDPELQEFVEAVFSKDKTIQRCLTDQDFRERICAVIFGLRCLDSFPQEKQVTLSLLLFERFGLREKEDRDDACELFDKIRPELTTLGEVEPKLVSSMNEFVRVNQKLWFENVSLENASQLLSKILPFEFDWVEKEIKQALSHLPRGVGKIEETIQGIELWSMAGKEEFRKRIEELRILSSLLKSYNLFPKTFPGSWEEWCDLYENVILDGELLLSEEMGRPSVRRDETWKVISSNYRKKRDEFIARYEDFLKTNYSQWIGGKWPKPTMVSDLMEYCLKDLVKKYETLFLLVFDGMRLDFWNRLKNKLTECFKVIDERRICSLIPSSTPISRYAIFSGKTPEDFGKADESAALQKALANIECERIREGRTAHSLLGLEKATGKVRSFIFFTTELHKEERSLATALRRFEASLPEIVDNIKDIVGKVSNSIVVITSDHGSCEAPEQLEFRSSEDEERNFHFERESRCWIVGEKVSFRDRTPILIERTPERKLRDFRQRTEAVLGDCAFIFEPEELRLVRSDGTIRYRGEIHRPFLVLIARKNCSLQKEMPFAHGGLTPYETIVPFAVLEPR